MKMDAIELSDILKSLDIKQVCIETAQDAEDEMIRLQQDQLAAGKRADGTDIAPPYTAFTIFKKETEKEGLAAVTDVVTLFDTGEHYSKIYAKTYPDGMMEFGSTDKKSPGLEKKYGEKIRGLDEDSREALIDETLDPDFQRRVKNLTGL